MVQHTYAINGRHWGVIQQTTLTSDMRTNCTEINDVHRSKNLRARERRLAARGEVTAPHSTIVDIGIDYT